MKRLILIALLAIPTIGGCGIDELKPWIPTSTVIVDGQRHMVEHRQWCDSGSPCEIQPDGRVAVIHIGEELRFHRGIFIRYTLNADPVWVDYVSGEYLLATTATQHVMVVHYPLATPAGQTD